MLCYCRYNLYILQESCANPRDQSPAEMFTSITRWLLCYFARAHEHAHTHTHAHARVRIKTSVTNCLNTLQKREQNYNLMLYQLMYLFIFERTTLNMLWVS